MKEKRKKNEKSIIYGSGWDAKKNEVTGVDVKKKGNKKTKVMNEVDQITTSG